MFLQLARADVHLSEFESAKQPGRNMSQPMPDSPAGVVVHSRGQRLRRVLRLALKETRETLRDRRTLVTLVLMPFLLYPLLSLVLRKFMITGGLDGGVPTYAVACATSTRPISFNAVAEWASHRQRRQPEQKLPLLTFWVAEKPGGIAALRRCRHRGADYPFPPDESQPAQVWEWTRKCWP